MSIKESNLTAVVDMTPVMSVTVSEPALTNYLSSFGSCLGHPGHHLFNCFTRGTKPFIWCVWRDSNSQAVKHRYLKPACIPIPPQTLIYGALTTIRTRDIFITSEVLYQLSYKGNFYYIVLIQVYRCHFLK